MATATFLPSPPPAPTSSKLDRATRVVVAQFGDGYAQHAVDGLNTTVRSAQLSWDWLTSAELTPIVAFFDNLQGVSPFYWMPFGESTYKLFKLDWTTNPAMTVSPVNAGIFSLRVSIRQVFDIPT